MSDVVYLARDTKPYEGIYGPYLIAFIGCPPTYKRGIGGEHLCKGDAVALRSFGGTANMHEQDTMRSMERRRMLPKNKEVRKMTLAELADFIREVDEDFGDDDE